MLIPLLCIDCHLFSLLVFMFVSTLYYSMFHYSHLLVTSRLVSSQDKHYTSITTLAALFLWFCPIATCMCVWYNFTHSSITFVLRMKYPVDSLVYLIYYTTYIVLYYIIAYDVVPCSRRGLILIGLLILSFYLGLTS